MPPAPRYLAIGLKGPLSPWNSRIYALPDVMRDNSMHFIEQLMRYDSATDEQNNAQQSFGGMGIAYTAPGDFAADGASLYSFAWRAMVYLLSQCNSPIYHKIIIDQSITAFEF